MIRQGRNNLVGLSNGVKMHKGKSVVVAAISAALMFIGSVGQAYACKCAEPGSPLEELKVYSAVFAGKVVSIQHSFDPGAESFTEEDRTTVRFEVSTVWKGVVHEDMYVTTPPTGGSCGFSFVEGEEYVVYGYDSHFDNDGYSVGICSRTAMLQEAQVDLAALGQGDEPLAGTGGPAPGQSFLDGVWNTIRSFVSWLLGSG